MQSLALGFLLALGACTFQIGPPSVPRPEVVYEPEIVGRISDVSHDGVTNKYTVTVGGKTFDIEPDARSLEGSPGSSDSLLIYGVDDSTTWYVSLGILSTGEMKGCGLLTTTSAWDAGDSILFAFSGFGRQVVDVGVLLPKATAWDQSITLLEDGRYPQPYTDWCIDISGRVEAVSEGAGG